MMDNHEEHDKANRFDLDSKLEIQLDSSNVSQDASSSLLHSANDSSVTELMKYAYHPDGKQSSISGTAQMNEENIASNEDSGNDCSILQSAENEIHYPSCCNLGVTRGTITDQSVMQIQDWNKLFAWDATQAKSRLENYKSTVKSFGSFFSELEHSGRRLSSIPSITYNNVFLSSGPVDVSSNDSATSSVRRPLFSCDGEDSFTTSAPHSCSSTPLRQLKESPLTSTLKVPLPSLANAHCNVTFSLEDCPQASNLVKLMMECKVEYQRLLVETIGYCEKAQKNMLKMKESQRLKEESAAHEVALKINDLELKHLDDVQELRRQHSQQMDELRSEIARLEKTVAEKTQKSEELFVLNGDLCKDFEVIKDKLKNSEKSSLVLGHKMNQMQSELIEIYATNVSLNTQKKQLDGECITLAARSRTLEEEVQRLRNEKDVWLARVDMVEHEHGVDREVALQEQLMEVKCEMERLLQQREDENIAADNELHQVTSRNKEEVARLMVMLEAEKVKHREALSEVDTLTDELEQVKKALKDAQSESAKYKNCFKTVQEELAEEAKALKEERLRFTAITEKSVDLQSQLCQANKKLQNTLLHLETHKESLAQLERVNVSQMKSMGNVQRELNFVKDGLEQILVDETTDSEGAGIALPFIKCQGDLSTEVTDMLEKIRRLVLSNRKEIKRANSELSIYCAELKATRVELDKSETTVKELEDNRALQKEALKAIQENVAMTLETLATLRQDRHQELTALNEVAKMITVDSMALPAPGKEASKLRKLFEKLLQKQTVIRTNLAQLERRLRTLSENSIPKFDESICGKSFSQSGASILEEQDSVIEDDLQSSQSPVERIRRSSNSKCTRQPDDALFKTLRKVFRVKRSLQKKCCQQTRKVASFRARVAQLKKDKGALEQAITEGLCTVTHLKELVNEKELQLNLTRKRLENFTLKICATLSEVNPEFEAMVEDNGRSTEIDKVSISLKALRARFNDALQLDGLNGVRLDTLLRCFFMAVASFTSDQKELLALRDELADLRSALGELRVEHNLLEQTRSSVTRDNGILHKVIASLSSELEGFKTDIERVHGVRSVMVSSKKLEIEVLAGVETYFSRLQDSLCLVKSKVGESARAVVSLEESRSNLVLAVTSLQEESLQAKVDVKRLESALKQLEDEQTLGLRKHEQQVESFSKLLAEKESALKQLEDKQALGLREHEQQVESFSKLLAEKELQMAELGDRFREAREKWEQEELRFVENIEQLGEDFTKLQTECTMEKEALCVQLEEERGQHASLSRSLDELQEKMEQHSDRFNLHNRRQLEVSEEMDNQIKRMRDQIQQMNDEMRMMIDEVKSKDAHIEEMREENKQKCEEMRRSVMTIELKEEEIKRMAREIDTKECEIELKNKDISQKDAEIEVLMEEARKQVAEFNTQCDLLRQQKVELEAIVTEMEANNTSLKVENEQLLDLNSVSEKEKLEMLRLNSLLKEELKLKSEELEDKSAELKAKECETTQQQNLLEKLQSLVEEKEDELTIRTKELESVRADMLALEKSHARTLQEKEDVLTLLEENREQLRVSDAATEEWKVMAQVQERRSDGVEALNNTVRDLEERNGALAATLAKKQHKLDEVEKHHAAYKLHMTALRERFREAQREIDSYKQKIAQLTVEAAQLQRVARQSSADEAQQRRQCEQAVAQLQRLRLQCQQFQEQLAELRAARAVSSAPAENGSSQGSSDVVPDSQPDKEPPHAESARPAVTTKRRIESAAKPVCRARPATSQSGGGANTRLALSLHSRTSGRAPAKVSVDKQADESTHGSLNGTSTLTASKRWAEVDTDCISSNRSSPTITVEGGSVRHARAASPPAPSVADSCDHTRAFATPADGDNKYHGRSSAAPKRSLLAVNGNNKRMRRAPTEVSVSSLLRAAAAGDSVEGAAQQVPVSKPRPDVSSFLKPTRPQQQPPHRSTLLPPALTRVALCEALHTARAAVASTAGHRTPAAGHRTPAAGHRTPAAVASTAGHRTPSAVASTAGHRTPAAVAPSVGHRTPACPADLAAADRRGQWSGDGGYCRAREDHARPSALREGLDCTGDVENRSTGDDKFVLSNNFSRGEAAVDSTRFIFTRPESREELSEVSVLESSDCNESGSCARGECNGVARCRRATGGREDEWLAYLFIGCVASISMLWYSCSW